MSVLFYIIVILMSVVIHEVAHGVMANVLGDPTARLAGRLTLNPLKHLDPLGSVILPAALIFLHLPVIGWAKPVPYNPYNLKAGRLGPAYVAAAGPLSNLVIVAFFATLIRWGVPLGFFSLQFAEFATVVVSLNLMLAIFNLIPVPPLDGSKIIFAALPYRWAYIQNFLERYQLALILVLIYFAGNILLPLHDFFLHLLIG